MNKSEYEKLQQAAKAAALETMFSWQIQIIPGLLLAIPSSEIRSQSLSVLRRKLDTIRQETDFVAFPELPPEQSDLWAAESQAAYLELVDRFEKALDALHPKT